MVQVQWSCRLLYLRYFIAHLQFEPACSSSLPGYKPSSQLHARPSKPVISTEPTNPTSESGSQFSGSCCWPPRCGWAGLMKEGRWCPKQETRGEHGRCDDEGVKKEPKSGEPSHDRQNIIVVLQEIPREPESQEDQCTLKNQW